MKSILVSLLTILAFALPATRAADKFREGDVFEIRVSGPPEEYTREFNMVLTVDEGSVTVPLVGRVAALGMSSTALASSIQRRLVDGKIFAANVNVNITTSQTQRTVIVGGAVRSPGKQPWVQNLTLTGAISSAGGATDFATDKMKIIRGGTAATYSRKAIKKNPSLDPKIETGDIVEQEGD